MNAALLNSGHLWHPVGIPLLATRAEKFSVTSYTGPKRLIYLVLCYRDTYSELRGLFGTWEHRSLWLDATGTTSRMYTFYKTTDEM